MRGGLLKKISIRKRPGIVGICAAGYPEKHFEAMNLTSDLKHLKAKPLAGIITYLSNTIRYSFNRTSYFKTFNRS